MLPLQRLSVKPSTSEARFDSLPQTLLCGGFRSPEQHVQFTRSLEVHQIIKPANMLVAHHDLRNGSRPTGGASKGALNRGVVFQSTFFVGHSFSIEQTLGLNASTAAKAGPDDHRCIAALNHAPRASKSGFKIGGLWGLLSVGFIG